MFGVIDETGKLEYGQVFVQYSSDASLGYTTPEDTKILKGRASIFLSERVLPSIFSQFPESFQCEQKVFSSFTFY